MLDQQLDDTVVHLAEDSEAENARSRRNTQTAVTENKYQPVVEYFGPRFFETEEANQLFLACQLESWKFG